MSQGLRINRRFTKAGEDPYNQIEWSRRDSRITNPDGSTVFEMTAAEIPAAWSQVAADIMVSKYFRKAGVPQFDDNGDQVFDDDGQPELGPERSARQVFDRLAGTWRHWGEKEGYFASSDDASAFEDELKFMLATQMAAPNSPQWFNTGLNHAYGLTGPAQGFWYVDGKDGEMKASPDSYSRPSPHACFPAGAKVTTNEGSKAIEKIEPGDLVLTHQGRYQPVLETMQRQVDESLVRLTISKLTAEDVVATANHPVLAVRSKEARGRYFGVEPTPEWIEAGDLEPGDYVIVSRPPSDGIIPEPIDLAGFAGANFEVTESEITTRNSAHHPTMRRRLDLSDPAVMRLFGRWLGEGSIGHESRDGELASVNFVFNGEDDGGITDIQDLMKRAFGVETTLERAKGQNTTHLRYTRRPLARWFHHAFGEGFATKQVPVWVFNLPRRHRVEFLVGLFAADGCVLDQGNSKSLCFDHSNEELAQAIWRIARSLGYSPALIGGDIRPGGTTPHYRIQISTKDAEELATACGVELPGGARLRREIHVGDEIGYRVKETSREPFFGSVYNFQVQEDESYVVNNVVVHNCFILSVKDDLVNPGGIMDLWVREARIFKFGSGAGSNFSQIRGENEQLSGGGKSSGVMSFLKIGDRAAGAIKCLHEDTEITTDQGTFKIKDVEPGDMVVTRTGLRNVAAVHDNGTRPMVRIRTQLGDEILATPEHRFWVRNERGEQWKEAGDIEDHDKVLVDLAAMPTGTFQPLKPVEKGHFNETAHDLPLVLNESFALWLGWVAGDGSVTTRPGAKFVAVQIGDEDPELVGRYTNLVKDVFGPEAHIYVNRRSDGRDDASASVRFSSSQVIRFLEANGLRKTKADTVRVPGLVKSSPAAVRAAFLSGLFEADGHVDNGYPVLSTVSQDLAHDVHRLLLGLGIPSAVKTQHNRTGAIGSRPIHLVRIIGGEGVRRFSKLVGFVSERKDALLARAVDRKSASPFETQWVLPHASEELNAIWESGSPTLRRAIAPYCRYETPRSLSLLRARVLVDRFSEELAGTVVERFALGTTLYQSVEVEPAGVGRVYDLTVEDIHEYTVHGLVTHNSGGTTRRAAKMVILDVDHPDIEKFIDWKKLEEDKARVLINHGGFPADFNGDAYATVSGQNSNNSVRVTNEFVERVLDDGEWDLINRTDGSVRKTVKARDLWNQIAEAAWACADPGLQFDTTINEWHTSPAGGRIRGSNPCSEYMYLDDTACNLASLNFVTFYDDKSGIFDIEAYQHAVRLWTIVLEISVAMAHFPSKEIAQGSYDYRTLGLGYANLGSLLMRQGIAYDSDEGRAIAGALTAILTGYSYATSAEIAGVVGPFPRFAENRDPMLRVIRNHRRAAYNEADYEDVSHRVMALDPELCPPDLLEAAKNSWDLALEQGERNGYRNGQVTCIAPTGTIALLMDCDTTGVEPDFALVKFKKLAGGGYFKIANQSVAPALRHLGYEEGQNKDVVEYIVGTSSIDGAPHINRETLTAKGFEDEDLAKLEAALPAVFELKHAFNVFTFGEPTLQRLGFGVNEYTGWDFNLLKAIGFTSKEISEANDHICGRQTIEGAPGLKDEHLSVFDTANKNGKIGERFIHHYGHIKMMAAAQPFISGAISKCVIGETLLTTEDGLVRIDSLHRAEEADTFRDEVMEVASLGGPRKTDAFYYGGMRQVRTITLRSGHRITGTPNHRVLIAAQDGLEWRYLSEIQPGEQVTTQYGADMWSPLPARFDRFAPSQSYGNQKTVRIPTEMTEDLAFLLGAIAAEGHITPSNWTVIVTNADEGVLRRIARIWRDEFGIEAPIRRPPDRCPSVQVSSKTIVEFLDFVGVGNGAFNKRIPDAVLRSPRRMVLTFLSGLFLDGYVNTSGMAKMGITVASAQLMDDLQAVLTNLGVVHGRSAKVASTTGNTYHEVYAAGAEGQALARLVPFAESAKAEKAEELLSLQFSQSTADVIPGISGRELYEMMPLDRADENGNSERLRFTFLLDPRTKHVSRRTLERVAMVPGVELPEWLNQVLADGLHFTPVSEVVDAGQRDVYDISVPETHAFVGNGIVNHNTINMPNEITVKDIEESYRMSWEWGLKAMALYRDGSKAAQPLNSTSDEGEGNDDEDPGITAAVEAEKAIHWGNLPAGISPSQAYARGMKPPRFLLPSRRQGFNQEARIGGHKVFLRTGEYDDGTLGEIFIDLAKEGATLKGILSCFAIAVSKGLQYGVPLEEFVDTFTFQTFEPRGMVEGHPNIKMSNSIVDYVFRALGVEYLLRDDLAQVPPNRDGELAGPPKGLAVEAGVQLDLSDAAAEGDVDLVQRAADYVDSPHGSAGDVKPLPTQMHAKVAAYGAATTEPITGSNAEAMGAAVAAGSAESIDRVLAENMGDAPVCSNCGHMTIRNGSCYVCLTCGDTTGCS